MDSRIPNKLYFKIGEVAKLVSVEPHVLRFWETEFPQISPSKSKTKQRLYKRDDVKTIFMIRDLLYEQKFTIEGARKKLKDIMLQSKEKKKVQQQQITLGFSEDQSGQNSNTQNIVRVQIPKKVKTEMLAVIKEMENYLRS